LVTVNDVEVPNLMCPYDINRNNDAGQCSAVVDYNVPVGIDNCPTTTVRTTGLGDDAAFPIGETIETYQTTDLGGNTGIYFDCCRG
jgi:hypothetical protein